MSRALKSRRNSNKKDIIKCNGAKLQKMSKLGEGTYGIVYKCKNLKTKKLYAVKKIRSRCDDLGYEDDDGLSTTTIREIALLQELSSHQNIVTLHDVSFDLKSTALYLLFELQDMDLKKFLNKCNKKSSTEYISSFDIKYIMHQIMNGIAYCHKLHIFHRDLKPQNILINEKTKKVTIADFGLARTYSFGFDKPGLKREYTHEVITLWYRAPEILLGDDQYLPSVDIWSIGCIFAEIVNRSQPLFRGDSEISQLLKIFAICGTINEENYPNCNEKLKFWQNKFPKWKEKKISAIVPNLDSCGQDLLKRMLQLHPLHRITSKQTLRHPYFRKTEHDDIPSFPETRAFNKRKTSKLSDSHCSPYPENAVMAMV